MVLRFLKDTREYFTPVLTTSCFIEKGILTPDEFVRAGDQLVRNCPSWQWASGDADKLRSYLPRDKQFLMTQRVNCVKRIAQLKQNTVDVDVAGGLSGDGNEAWCATELRAPGDADTDADAEEDAVVISTADLTLDKASATTTDLPPVTGGGGKGIGTAESLTEEEFEDDSLGIGSYAVPSGVLRSRKYDLSITYDNYYRTPRIWLFGWDEDGNILDSLRMFEDIINDYAHRTVTIDPHPHNGRLHASVHPCQHAAAMLRIIGALMVAEKTPQVENYLFIFLKFVQSVIPTIEYDFTSEVDIMCSTSK